MIEKSFIKPIEFYQLLNKTIIMCIGIPYPSAILGFPDAKLLLNPSAMAEYLQNCTFSGALLSNENIECTEFKNSGVNQRTY